MSWLYSRALVEEYSGASCSGGEQCAPLNGTPLPLGFSLPDKMTALCRLSQFGMTFAALTADRGEALLTLCLAGSRAKTSAPPGKEGGLMASGLECGGRWPESFAKLNPAGSLWRTPQCSLFEDLEPCLEIWPEWGLMLDGECWELLPSARPTSGKESGLWPTPNCMDAMGARSDEALARAKLKGGCSNLKDRLRGTPNPIWLEWLMGWPQEWTKPE